MTLGQVKQIVRFLLDGDLVNEYEEKLNTYLDMGQKRIACTTDFLKRTGSIVAEQPKEVDLEAEFERFYRIERIEGGAWERLSPTKVRLQKGNYTVHYNIYPMTITPHTEDSYVFEISEAAQTALPYYAASQVTIAEHDLRYHQVYADEFAAILENVDEARRNGNIHIMGGTR